MTTTAPVNHCVIDGYDLVAEKSRYAFPDVEIAGARLNRGTAKVDVRFDPNDGVATVTRAAHTRVAFKTTHDADAPVIELGYPIAGHYAMARNGVHLDMYLGVAQKLLDENHPRLVAAVDTLVKYRLALRREIMTDDYHAVREGLTGIVTTTMVADELTKLAAQAFPRKGGYRVFLSNSGTEANEAAIKLAQRVRWRRLGRKYGTALMATLMQQLSIGTVAYFGNSPEPVYEDYPMFLVACEASFHGRTLGALHLTRSKRAHQIGYSKSRWTRHIKFNGAPDSLDAILDPRPLDVIVGQPGGVRASLDAGKVPAELVALFIAEGFQGEGGYVLGNRAFFAGIRATCTRHDILFVADEVQSFARTGQPFVIAHTGIAPDVITLAKGAWTGATIAPAELDDELETGWHSNTWGGGKMFDNAVSYATLTTLANDADPLFLGRGYFENERIKGEYLRQRLAVLAEKHSDVVSDFSGLGCMFGVTVKNRDELIRKAWTQGMKLLGAGSEKDGVGRLRVLFLADVLTKEIDDFIDGMDRVLSAT
ncbi:MAG: aminotransferase class III-fold pyridoxal phosphate-dependent enzyme [Planctomycetes bacterium]|nr:aminotransferase class III-fold pyridoxal phosphate-dependent enzyme [Planctomycetota bacterium]MCC7172605.1 aminotransferase class III-fold pyridoxal phosphate-dependent enzyme [Planctomycetota bacterium]